jgi:GDP-L-fucose synthase
MPDVIHGALRRGVNRLCVRGDRCFYPGPDQQPIPGTLLNDPLEATNEWLAIAKIAHPKVRETYCRPYGFDAISMMSTNFRGREGNVDLESSR